MGGGGGLLRPNYKSVFSRCSVRHKLCVCVCARACMTPYIIETTS